MTMSLLGCLYGVIKYYDGTRVFILTRSMHNKAYISMLVPSQIGVTKARLVTHCLSRPLISSDWSWRCRTCRANYDDVVLWLRSLTLRWPDTQTKNVTSLTSMPDQRIQIITSADELTDLPVIGDFKQWCEISGSDDHCHHWRWISPWHAGSCFNTDWKGRHC